MADYHALTNAGERSDIPEIRRLSIGDLFAALRGGWRDFWQKPSHLAFLGLIYPVVGAALAVWSSGNNSWPLLFPLITGFALIGPFAALPIYEMSRRQELGLDTHWSAAFDVFRTPAFASIAALGVWLMIVFTVWLMTAQFLYETLYGPGSPPSLTAFVDEVFNTSQGQTLMFWGNLVGFCFAVVALTTAVVSIPLLLDRDVGAAVAVQTSIRVVQRNPLVIAIWGLLVVAVLLLGALPFLVGLAIAVPVLGHATWHLYRRAVVPAGDMR
ncbi:MAG: DUF2189 domain-containing protein [Hyphomicrobiales bacterium]|nr:MAG: DUF2189 domain-containing protein [Hyphomicrobiales bacterium]